MLRIAKNFFFNYFLLWNCYCLKNFNRLLLNIFYCLLLFLDLVEIWLDFIIWRPKSLLKIEIFVDNGFIIVTYHNWWINHRYLNAFIRCVSSSYRIVQNIILKKLRLQKCLQIGRVSWYLFLLWVNHRDFIYFSIDYEWVCRADHNIWLGVNRFRITYIWRYLKLRYWVFILYFESESYWLSLWNLLIMRSKCYGHVIKGSLWHSHYRLFFLKPCNCITLRQADLLF